MSDKNKFAGGYFSVKLTGDLYSLSIYVRRIACDLF